MNVPYQKQFDKNGKCVNEITRLNPLFNHYPNRKARRTQKVRHRGNHKGVSLVATHTEVIKRVFQYLKDRTITHYIIKYFNKK